MHFAVMAIVALLVGFGLSYYALTDGRFFGVFQLGAWTTRPDTGSPEPDPYSRAFIARSGLLHLSRGEGVEFVARTDDDGERLTRDCTYRIAGITPVAAFWTLRAEDDARVNAGAAGSLTYLHSRRLAREADGSFVIHAGGNLSPGNWLELTGEGPFSLILTFYDASFFAGFGTTVSALPAIVRESCP